MAKRTRPAPSEVAADSLALGLVFGFPREIPTLLIGSLALAHSGDTWVSRHPTRMTGTSRAARHQHFRLEFVRGARMIPIPILPSRCIKYTPIVIEL